MLVAMQLPSMSVPPNMPLLYTTIYGVHSRAVSGLASVPGNQFISCALDSSVQTFKLDQSHDSHVIPSPVAMETYTTLSSDAQRTAHGVVVSEYGLYVAVLTR